MIGTILEKIIDEKRLRVEAVKRSIPFDRLAEHLVSLSNSGRFHKAISDSSNINIIAEFKRASPSKGLINDSRDPATVAKQYERGGATAISVLTEEDFFKGSLDDLRAVRAATDLPILRKDFIIDEYQIYESAYAEADAILLIVAALDPATLLRFHSLADEFGLDAVVEVHDPSELETAIEIGAKIIGVNNRNLKTFDVSLDVSRELIKRTPEDVVMITESGLKTHDDLVELYDLGYTGFLIGETLMRSGDPTTELRRLTGNDES